MGRTVCTEPQCLYKSELYLYLLHRAGYVYTITGQKEVYGAWVLGSVSSTLTRRFSFNWYCCLAAFPHSPYHNSGIYISDELFICR